MKPCRLAGLIAWLAVAAGASAGEGPAVQEDPIARALGLRGHRVEILPPGVEHVRPLADGRVVVVMYGAGWLWPAGGPEREAGNPAVIWVRIDQAREKAASDVYRNLVDARGRAFFGRVERAGEPRGQLYWLDGGAWHEENLGSHRKSGASLSQPREDSRGRVWLTAGAQAVCVDVDNRVRKFSLMPGREDQVVRSCFELAENTRGDLLICMTSAWSGGNGYEEVVVGSSRTWLFSGGDLDKGREVDLPWNGRSPLALTGTHWGFTAYEKPMVIMSLDPAGGAPADAPDARLRKLLDQLDDDSWEKREEASARLVQEFRFVEDRVKQLARTEKRPEVKARLEKVLESWASGAGREREAKVWLGPLAGGERFLSAQAVEVRGTDERHLLVTGLWLPGQPEPQPDPKDQHYCLHLVRMTKDGKLQPVASSKDPGGEALLNVNRFLGLLPDGRLLCHNTYMGWGAPDRMELRVWDGRKFTDVPRDDFHLWQIGRVAWRTDRAGRYYSVRNWSDNWWIYDPKGAPVDAGYKTAAFAALAFSRRDSRDTVWHVLNDEWPKTYYPLKGELVRFEGAEPRRLGEIDLSTADGKKPDFASGTGDEPPVVTPFGPDAAVVSFRYRSYLYSAGKLEKFEGLGELLRKHRAAVVEGLQAEQKVCRHAWRLAADDAGNLWFWDPAERQYDRRLKVLSAAGELLVAKDCSPVSSGGVLPVAGGMAVRSVSAPSGWAVVKVTDGAFRSASLEGLAKGEEYNHQLALRRADGGAVLGGKILVGPDGSSRRLLSSESSKLVQETAGGWQLVSSVLPRRFAHDYRWEYSLARGDMRVGLPFGAKFLLESPGSGQLLACLIGGVYRVTIEDAGAGADRRVRLDEVVPSGAYQGSATFEFFGEHAATEDFIDGQGYLWQIGQRRVARVEPPPEVRASLLGKKQ